MYTLALDDYLTPLDDMCKAMMAARGAGGHPEIATEVGYRYIAVLLNSLTIIILF